MSEIWEEVYEQRRARLRDKRETREALAEIERRLDDIEKEFHDLKEAVKIIVYAIALGETTLPGEIKHQHGLCGRATAYHLVDVARSLEISLEDLGLDYLDF